MTATIPAHADIRDCRLYRFRVYHPHDMHLPADQRRVELGYIGETVRMPLARLLEHLYDQPWADTIVGWDVDPRIFPGKAAVLAAERQAIEDEMPLYNVEWNRGNDKRIPPPKAIRQRRARDAASGGPRWVHPDDRGGPVRAAVAVRPRPPAQRRWSSRRKHLTGLAAAQTVLLLAGWIALLVYGQWRRETVIAVAVAALVLPVWVWAGCPIRKRGRRKAAARIRKRLQWRKRRSR